MQKGARHAPEAEVRRCDACGLVFLWPRPHADELADYYEACYREDYGDLPAEKRYREDLREARRRVERLFPLLEPSPRVLEIGCGTGAFLDAARPYVEHLPAPVSCLRSLEQLLGVGAKVVIEVPNVDDALVSLYEIPAYQRFYYQKAHLLYFSADTLNRTLDRSGFGADIRGLQRYDLSNHMRWMLTGQPGGQGFYESTLPDAVGASYAEALIRAGRSDTLWAVAQPRQIEGQLDF